MSEKPVTYRSGVYHVVYLSNDWHVLFEPDDAEHTYVSVARFTSEDRAHAYAEMEQQFSDMDASDADAESSADLLALKAVDEPRSVLPLLMHSVKELPTEVVRVMLTPPLAKAVEASASETQVQSSEESRERQTPNPAPEMGTGGSKPEASPPDVETPSGVPAGTAAPSGPGRKATVDQGTRSAQLLAAMSEHATPNGRVDLLWGELSSKSGVPKGSLGFALTVLEESGLIRREAGTIYLTDTQGRSGTAREASGTLGGREDAKAPSDVGVKPAAPSPEGAGHADEPAAMDRHGGSAPALQRRKAWANETPRKPVPPFEPGFDPKAPSTAPKPAVAAFKSDAPLPAWRKPTVEDVTPPPAGDKPERLAVVGNYVIAGSENVRVSTAEAAAMQFLIAAWNTPAAIDTLIEEMAGRARLKSREARKLFDTVVGRLNEELPKAGLSVVVEEAGVMLKRIEEQAA